MTLYHGSKIGGIEALRPFMSNHGRPYVYLTNSQVLAAIYAANPMERPNGWFPYWWSKDGKLHYDEYYSGQLEEIYRGRTGYVYTCQGDYPVLEKMPWVYLSEGEAPVCECRVIPDLYEQLLKFEAEGRLTIRRWAEHPPERRAAFLRVIKQSLQDHEPSSPHAEEYRNFVYARFPELRP